MAAIVDVLEESDVQVRVLTDQPELDAIYNNVKIRITRDGVLVVNNQDGTPAAWFPEGVWLKVEFINE